jgi:5-(carboxyamino)imidazole ribonucleotide mutase
VQMPKGIPVATVAIDAAQNAGILVAEMLAIGDADLAAKLADHRAEIAG